MWENELAKKIKKTSSEAKRKAVKASIATIGEIVQISPIKVSISEYELYEGSDVIIPEHLKEHTQSITPITIGTTTISSVTVKAKTLTVGDKVLCVPCQDLEQILIIDKVGD